MKKKIITALILVVALAISAAGIVWIALCDAHPGAAYVPVPGTPYTLPEIVTIPTLVIVPYLLFITVYFNLYTTGVNKGYVSESVARSMTLIGAAVNMFCVSYYSVHGTVDVSGLVCLPAAYLFVYFWNRLFESDREGALDTRAANMVGILAVSTIVGLHTGQVLPFMLTVFLLVCAFLSFVRDAYVALRAIIRAAIVGV